MMQNHKYTLLTIFLTAIFIGPFIISLKDRRLEIYPSIILPGGSFIMKSGAETLTLYSNDISGVQERALTPIPKQKFLGEIPIQNYYTLV